MHRCVNFGWISCGIDRNQGLEQIYIYIYIYILIYVHLCCDEFLYAHVWTKIIGEYSLYTHSIAFYPCGKESKRICLF